jgi:hypothetical protein
MYFLMVAAVQAVLELMKLLIEDSLYAPSFPMFIAFQISIIIIIQWA